MKTLYIITSIVVSTFKFINIITINFRIGRKKFNTICLKKISLK